MSTPSAAVADPIYYEDVRVLWAESRFKEIWPSPDMSTEERVNAMVRFCGYAGLALYVARHGDDRFLLYSLTAIAVLTLAYRFSTHKRMSERWTDLSPGQSGADTQAYLPPPGTTWEQVDDVSADSGRYLCQPPTRNNPFGNLLPTDISDNPNRPPACKYDDVKSDIKRTFDDQQYRDVTDIYGNSGRAFHTMPVTDAGGGDFEAFKNFVYKDFQNASKNRYVNPW